MFQKITDTNSFNIRKKRQQHQLQPQHQLQLQHRVRGARGAARGRASDARRPPSPRRRRWQRGRIQRRTRWECVWNVSGVNLDPHYWRALPCEPRADSWPGPADAASKPPCTFPREARMVVRFYQVHCCLKNLWMLVGWPVGRGGVVCFWGWGGTGGVGCNLGRV